MVDHKNDKQNNAATNNVAPNMMSPSDTGSASHLAGSEIDRLRIEKANNEQLLSDERLLRHNQEIALIKTNQELADKIIKLQQASEEAKVSRRAALNLMEDAITAKDALRVNEERMRWQKEAFQAAVNGAPLYKSLDIIASLIIEETKGAARTAFFMADEAGEYLHPVFGAGNMELDYLRIIDGFKIGKDSIACGLAIPTGQPILTTDILKDPRWYDEIIGIAEKYDFRSCWSFPIKTFEDKAVGTFAMLFKDAREATVEDLALADIVIQTAAVIISNFTQAQERARMEVALRESERKYRKLFNTIDEGFCIIEMIYDASGKPCNWRFIEVNPAFEQNNGLKDATGKTILELTPGIEPKWFEIYGRVAQTGEPLRFDENSEALGRAFSLYAFPTGSADQHRIAVLFRNTTDRKRRESNLAFLADLTQDFALLSDTDHIMQTVSKKIGAYLNITTCNLTDVDEANDTVTVHNGWNDPSVQSTVGSFRLSQYLSKEFERACRAGETVVVANTQTDQRTDAAGYAALEMYSFVTVPFHNQGKWTHFIAVCDAKPREWRRDEIELIEEVSNRIFLRLERARAEDVLLKVKENHLQELEKEVRDRTADLNQSRDQLQSVLDTTLIQMSILEAVRDQHNRITDFRIVVANEELKKETGKSDLVGKLYAEEYPGIKEAGLFDLIIKTIETSETQQLDYFYSHDGFKKWYSCMFVKFGDGVVASNIDITSRKQAEEERFKNYLLMQQTENLALLGSWDYDLLSQTLSWSDGMYQLFNLDRSHTVSPEIYLQCATAECKDTAAQIVKNIKSGHIDFEEILKVEIGESTKALKVKVTSIKNGEGQQMRLLGVDMDITASLDAAQKMRQMEDQQQLEIFKVTLRTEEEERHRISESLHNGIAQILYGIKINMTGLHFGIPEEKFTHTKVFVNKLLTDAIVETRRVSHELMPTTLEQFGLKSAIEDICRQFTGGVKFSCHISGLHSRLEKYMELAVYRTTQELMTNVVKHANATECEVKIVIGADRVYISVKDNGNGIPVDIGKSDGIGLASIRSKIELLNGQVNVSSIPNKGTHIEVSIPHQGQSINNK